MQHVFEFIAVKKLTPEEEEFNKNNPESEQKVPLSINRYFNTQSNRMSKVSEIILKEIEKTFGLKREMLKGFYLKPLR